MRYESLIRSNFEVQGVSGAEFQCLCPWHPDGNKGNLYVNADTGLYICFSCGEKGQLDKQFQRPPADVETVRNKLKKIREPRIAPRILTSSHLKVFRMNGVYDAWAERGLTPEIVDKFQLGFDPIDNNSLVIPVTDRYRRPFGFIIRRTDGRLPKYLYPEGLKMSSYVFGIDHLRHRHQKVAVVEGAIDAMSCWQARVPAVAIYGDSLQDDQELQLKRAQIRHLVLMLDNDKAGMIGAEKIKNAITWCRVTNGVYRPYWEAKDPGELSGQQIRKMFHSSGK